MDNISLYAMKLESILRDYLKCGYNDFRVKANDWLKDTDWSSAVYFALGCKYGELGKSEEVKEKIDYFLGNDFWGDSITDIVINFNSYGFVSKESAYEYINNTINKIDKLLKL